jgi:uracil-DNA glycosylase
MGLTAVMPWPPLPESWQASLQPEFDAAYMQGLTSFLQAEQNAGKSVYPQRAYWFRALELTPLERVRAVIIGQDPYHGPDQAHGLCFSVPNAVRPPPSLVNIYKELESDLGITRCPHGNLEHWARQGVLLLNSVLTVAAGQPASHSKRGWEKFTDAVIRAVNDRADPAVFLIWGKYAQEKAAIVDADKHLVLTAAHPSPLAAYTGFFGCRHFSQTNAFLSARNLQPIDWAIPAARDQKE